MRSDPAGRAGCSGEPAGHPSATTHTGSLSSPSADELDAARSGDPDALARLYTRYRRPLYAIAFSLLGSRDDAEDVVQEVFVRLPKALCTFGGYGSFESWIGRLATTTSLLELRRQRWQVSLTALGELGANHGPDDSVAHIALEQAISGLPERLRIVLILHDMEGLTHQQIGDRLGIKWMTSGQRLHRARVKLRSAL